MEQLISDICAFAKKHNLSPSSVLQNGAGLGGTAWKRWQNGGGCSVKTEKKIRDWMGQRDETRARGAK